MGERVNKTLDIIENIFASIAGILILFSLVSVVLEVVLRFITGHSLVWVQEYNEYVLLYIPFLSGAWLLRNNDHVVINLIDYVIHERSFNKIQKVVALLGAITMLVILYYGTIVTIDLFERGVASTTVLKTPQVYVYIVIPIGSLLMALEFIRMLFKVTKGKENSVKG